MTRRRPTRRGAVLVGAGLAAACFAAFGASPAAAHPLGNFSVNHLDTLTITPTGVIDDAVIDAAEIPTAQAASSVDADGDGTASPDELAAHGRSRCEAFAGRVTLRIDQSPVTMTVTSSSFEYAPGQAGLDTSRLECRLEAPVDFAVPHQVDFEDRYLPDRTGWHEINAVSAEGVRIVDSPVPTSSITSGLTDYPVDLLSSPLDVRSVSLDVQPGAGPSTVGSTAVAGVDIADDGFFSSIVSRVQRTFDDLIGRRDLTLGVGLLAIALALLLGASHALLPGHGKTVMAAYIAGRQGSIRDAVIVGATVTGTHTGGVLVLGTALTLSTSLAGESILGWLGITSGLLVAALGAGLLLSALRHRGTGGVAHGHSHGYRFGHTHSHDGASPPGHGGAHHAHPGGAAHDHDHDHGHGHDHDHHHHGVIVQAMPALLGVSVDRNELVRSASPGGSTRRPPGAGVDLLSAEPATTAWASRSAVSLLTPSVPEATGKPSLQVGTPDASHSHDEPPSPVSRRGLVGMGIAGGLVPSPSALIILLSAIALGRTWFGILLVFAYGAGMAGTLTAAGVLLVTIRDRFQRRADAGTGRVRAAAQRWRAVAPFVTAGLVLVVGLGLALRSAGQI